MTRPERPIRGLLFDKDGTLFDFAATWVVVTETVLAALSPDPEKRAGMARAVGYDAAARRFAPGSAIVAGTIDDIAGLWAPFRPDLGAEMIAQITGRLTDEAVAKGALVPVMPDLGGFLGELRERGYLVGVATNDDEAAARQQLGLAGVLDRIDFLAGADSGHGAKPGPGMLLGFARATGIAPAEVAVIGDSLHDMAMAEGAGLRIGVLTGPAGAEELAAAADMVIDSIADLPEMLDGLRNARPTRGGTGQATAARGILQKGDTG